MKEEFIIEIYVDGKLDHAFNQKRTVYPRDKARYPMQKIPNHFQRNKQGKPIMKIMYYKATAMSFRELIDKNRETIRK